MDRHHRIAPSYWDDRSPAAGGGDPLPDHQVTVAVVGAGVLGMLTAHRLADEGLSVAVVDKDDIAAGVTGRSTAKVTALHGTAYSRIIEVLGAETAAAHAAANRWGVDEIASLAEGIECDWMWADAVTYGNEGLASAVAEEGIAARAAGLDLAVDRNLDVGTARPAAVALTLARQGMLDPRRFCQGIAAALRERGVTVTTGCRVLDLEGEGLRTGDGPLRARTVVLATHLPLLDRGGQFATTEPSRSYVIAGSVDREPPAAMLLGLDDEGVSSVRPAGPGGGEVLVAGNRRDATTPGEHTSRLERWGAANVGLRAVSHRWSAHDHVPARGIPSVGPLPATPLPVYSGTGFAKWGFSNGAAAARIISDLVVGRRHPWPELASGPRLSVRAAATIVRRNLEVGRDYVGDRVAGRAALDPALIRPGEGAVGRIGDVVAAAHRKGDGTLVLVDPRCTHRGCYVRWNELDTTWDCPCHGSRFSAEGAVLAGPATDDLPPVDPPQDR